MFQIPVLFLLSCDSLHDVLHRDRHRLLERHRPVEKDRIDDRGPPDRDVHAAFHDKGCKGPDECIVMRGDGHAEQGAAAGCDRHPPGITGCQLVAGMAGTAGDRERELAQGNAERVVVLHPDHYLQVEAGEGDLPEPHLFERDNRVAEQRHTHPVRPASKIRLPFYLLTSGSGALSPLLQGPLQPARPSSPGS